MPPGDDFDRPVDPWRFFAWRPHGFDAIPPVDCPCWRLTRPLTGQQLPNHVCDNTMAATVYHRDAPAGAELTPDVAWPVGYIGDPLDGRGCPVPGAPGRSLALVVREWAQEDPSQTLARQLVDLARQGSWEGAGWRWAIDTARAEFRRWRRHHLDADPFDLVVDDAFDDGDRVTFGQQLWRAGLPPTPSVLRYLRAIGADVPKRRADLPARGLLVTTLVFVKTGPADDLPMLYDGNPEVRLAGPAELTTGPLWERAGEVARRHRDWLRELYGGHPLAERALRYRLQTGAFRRAPRPEDDALDYEREALRTADHLTRAAWCASADPDQAITKHLDGAYRRVWKRRKRAGIDPTPPPGWRERARAALKM